MRHGTSNRRQRSRGGRGGNSGNGGRRNPQQKTQVYDSNGPDVRIRGTAYQVTEKYMALAKDASSAGDIVLAESYLQHAEHYQRIISSWNDVQATSDDRSEKSQGAQPTPRQQGDDNSDLSLPASILGESSKASPSKEKAARTGELTTA